MIREAVKAHIDKVVRKEYGDLVAFDTETDGLHGDLVLASFCDKEGAWTEEPAFVYTEADRPLTVAGHHLAYDLRTLERTGLPWPLAMYFDTSVAEHLLDETEPFPDLGKLAQKYLNRKLGEWKEVKDNPHSLREYAKADAQATYDIARIQWMMLKEQGLLDYLLKVEMPLVPIIADMEHRGVAIDRAEVARRLDACLTEEVQLAGQLREILNDYDWSCRREGCVDGVYHYKRGSRTSTCSACGGTGVNPVVLTSGDYLIDILYNHLGLREVSGGRTDTGKLSTDKNTLPRLREQAASSNNDRAVAFIDALLRYRKVKKLAGTYYGPWLEGGERLHPSFHQTGAATGRWSSSKPNFQNVPPEARSCIIPDPGHVFVSVDYTQIELYLLAYLAGEYNILAAYAKGEDLHQLTADAAGVDRHMGKTINFALVYGLSLEALAEKLMVSVDRAQEIMHLVLSRFPKLPTYKASVINSTSKLGYAETMLGRRRRLPDVRSMRAYLKGRAERQAVNHTIQGSAGDLIKCAMIKTVLTLPYVQAVMQIHDEVIWQVPLEKVTEAMPKIKQCFETASKLVQPRVEVTLMVDRWEAKE